MKKIITSLFIIASFAFNYAQRPSAKVDINMEGRSASEVTEPGYTSWFIARVHSASITVSDVTYTLTATAPGNNATVRCGWSKALVQSPYLSRLVNDGVKVDNDTMLAYPGQGAGLELRISGLPLGKHTLQTYHNIWEDTTTINYCPINVYVNGVLVHDTVRRTVKAINPTNATILLTELDVTQPGQEMILKFEPVMNFTPVSGKNADFNITLNAFELNTDDASKQSRAPYPPDKDMHADADTGALTLSWQAAVNGYTQTHTLYFGLDSATVANATSTDPAICKGTLLYNTMKYDLDNLYNMNTYFWRVDQTDSSGLTTKGKIWSFRTRHDAFPGAEGYGRYAIGGRGGKVIYVTNLNDAGPGSFRYAVENVDGPRTILFSVSGIITLNSRLVINDPYVTVAGQTAPGKGICVRWAPIGVTGNDLIVQNMRLRLGIGVTYDGMGLTGANHSIIDHSSISWTIDEAFSSRGAKNITLQRTLISEALNAAGHANYPYGKQHGFAGSVGGDVGSLHHNLLAHCNGRNWSLAGGLDGNGYYAGRMDIFNTVVYNWGGRTTDGGAKEVNFVNNYYKPGAASDVFYALVAQHENVGLGMQRYYFNGNIMPGHFDETNQEQGRTTQGTVSYETFLNVPFFESKAKIQTAREAYKLVLSDVGCTQPAFDDHDIRIINETLTGTYSCNGSYTGLPGLPDHENDVNGWETYPGYIRASNWDTDLDGLPDWWENTHGLNPNSSAGSLTETNADEDKNGYTNLEEFLHWMSKPHYFIKKGESISIDLRAYTRGFTKNPAFAVSDIVNGTANIANNTSIVNFVSSTEGLAEFTFTVTDSEGTTMSQKIVLYIGSIPTDSSFGYTYYKDRALTQLVTVNPVTSIKTVNNSSNVSIYPNPARNALNVDLNTDINTSAEIRITDLSGKVLLFHKSEINKDSNYKNIDITKLTPGVYFLHIKGSGLNRTAKFIKK